MCVCVYVVAEDHAITDAMYCLDKILAAEKCDLKPFLKEIRKLASKQFFTRVLAKKILSQQRAAVKTPCVFCLFYSFSI